MEEERRTFFATVTGHGLQKSSKAGTPSVAIRFRTLFDVENPEVPVRLNIVHNLWLTYKCMERTVKELQEVFGWKGHNITDFNEPILVGKKCHLVCEIEEWEGEKRWRVVFVNKAGGFRPMETEALSELIAEVQPMVDNITGTTRPEIDRDDDISRAEFSEADDGGVTEDVPPLTDDDMLF